jgi:hypothetical protein
MEVVISAMGILSTLLGLLFFIIGHDTENSIKPHEASVCYFISGLFFLLGAFMFIIAIAG